MLSCMATLELGLTKASYLPPGVQDAGTIVCCADCRPRVVAFDKEGRYRWLEDQRAWAGILSGARGLAPTQERACERDGACVTPPCRDAGKGMAACHKCWGFLSLVVAVAELTEGTALHCNAQRNISGVD